MLVLPLNPVPSQTVAIVLNNQNCTINVYQKSTGLFCDLYVNAALIIAGVLALNANLIVRSSYLGFSGDLAFYDTKGGADPDYTGLGSRFILAYLTPTDLAAP